MAEKIKLFRTSKTHKRKSFCHKIKEREPTPEECAVFKEIDSLCKKCSSKKKYGDKK